MEPLHNKIENKGREGRRATMKTKEKHQSTLKDQITHILSFP